MCQLDEIGRNAVAAVETDTAYLFGTQSMAPPRWLML